MKITDFAIRLYTDRDAMRTTSTSTAAFLYIAASATASVLCSSSSAWRSIPAAAYSQLLHSNDHESSEPLGQKDNTAAEDVIVRRLPDGLLAAITVYSSIADSRFSLRCELRTAVGDLLAASPMIPRRAPRLDSDPPSDLLPSPLAIAYSEVGKQALFVLQENEGPFVPLRLPVAAIDTAARCYVGSRVLTLDNRWFISIRPVPQSTNWLMESCSMLTRSVGADQVRVLWLHFELISSDLQTLDTIDIRLNEEVSSTRAQTAGQLLNLLDPRREIVQLLPGEIRVHEKVSDTPIRIRIEDSERMVQLVHVLE